MGTWDVALFSDDIAADIKGDWQDGLRNGELPEALTSRLVKDYTETINDTDDSVVFWLALAASQFETGHLQIEIRDKALAIITAGGDVRRWADQDILLGGQRQVVLDKLATKLVGPQPKPKKLRKIKQKGTHFDVGDVIQLHTTENSSKALIVIVAHTEDYPKGMSNPIGELLLWEKTTLPSRSEMMHLPTLVTDNNGRWKTARPHLWILMTPTKKQAFTEEFGKVVAKDIMRKPSGNPHDDGEDGGNVQTSYTTWPALTSFLGKKSITDDIDLTKKRFSKSSRWKLF